MEFISSWTQGIIISVLITTIIEMILPNGNSKKYIKMLLGVFIVFNIITPIVSKVTGKEFVIQEIKDLGKYIDGASQYSINKIDSDNSSNIKEIYILNLKKDIKSKLEDMGYTVINVQISAKDDENFPIEKISLNIKKQKDKKDSNNSKEESNIVINEIDKVNKISIDIDNKNDEKGKENEKEIDDNSLNLTNTDIEKIKEFLSTTYRYNKKIININS